MRFWPRHPRDDDDAGHDAGSFAAFPRDWRYIAAVCTILGFAIGFVVAFGAARLLR